MPAPKKPEVNRPLKPALQKPEVIKTVAPQKTAMPIKASASKTVDDILEINRKLLKVLGNRLNMDDPAEEFAGNEFFYVTTFVSPDHIIRFNTDSAYICCGMMFPNLEGALTPFTSPTFTDFPVWVIEQMSAGRVLVQGSNVTGTLNFGVSSEFFDLQKLGTSGPLTLGIGSPFDCNQQFMLREPFLVPPGSVLRFTAKNPTTETVITTNATPPWVLLGYQVKL